VIVTDCNFLSWLPTVLLPACSARHFRRAGCLPVAPPQQLRPACVQRGQLLPSACLPAAPSLPCCVVVGLLHVVHKLVQQVRPGTVLVEVGEVRLDCLHPPCAAPGSASKTTTVTVVRCEHSAVVSVGRLPEASMKSRWPAQLVQHTTCSMCIPPICWSTRHGDTTSHNAAQTFRTRASRLATTATRHYSHHNWWQRHSRRL
jgi:hypothetical protein